MKVVGIGMIYNYDDIDIIIVIILFKDVFIY